MKKLNRILVSPFLAIIWVYKKFLSPFLPSACRYDPTCSVYAKQALMKHGLLKGMFLSIKRIFSCHPWGGSGHDPVP